MSREIEGARGLVATTLCEGEHHECDQHTNVTRVLHLEDNPDDQEIIRSSLAEGGLPATF